MNEALLFAGEIFIKPFQTLAYHAVMSFALCVCVCVCERVNVFVFKSNSIRGLMYSKFSVLMAQPQISLQYQKI